MIGTGASEAIAFARGSPPGGATPDIFFCHFRLLPKKPRRRRLCARRIVAGTGDDHAFHDHAQERSEHRGRRSRRRWSSSTRWARSSASTRRRAASSTARASAPARRARASSSATGDCTVKHGPTAASTSCRRRRCCSRSRTREEAIGWAERYGKILGDGEIELGKVNEPWDIGLMPAPENPPLQMLLIEKADAGHRGRRPQPEAEGRAHAPQDRDDQGRRARPLAAAAAEREGASAWCSPTTTCACIDGPFAESKELIGGFAVLELSGMDEAIAHVPPLRGDPRRHAGDRRPPRRPGRLTLSVSNSLPTRGVYCRLQPTRGIR